MSTTIHEDVSFSNEASLLEKLNGKSVLITGATGMLGAYLAFTIAHNSNARLILACRNEKKAGEMFAGTGAEFLFQDIRKPLRMDEDIDYILHTAGPVGPSIFENTPLEVISVNTEGTLSLVDYAVAHNCKGFVFASTHEVYGAVQGAQMETNPSSSVLLSNPRSCYILAKQVCENILVCATKQYGLRTMSARLSRMYGPLMNLGSGLFVCDFIKDMLNWRPVLVKGDLNLVRPLLYISDAAKAILKVLVFGEAGEAYNIQGDGIPTIGDIADICAGIGKQGVCAVKPDTRSLPPSGHWLNCGRLKSLGWSESVGIETGLERTVDFFANQRN